MARMRLASAHVINNKRWKIGTTFADSQGNAIAGDVVWTGMNSASWSPGMVDLDAGATTIKNGSRFSLSPAPSSDGVNSIDG